MERSVALKKLGKLLGKSLGYRVDPKAPDQEQRDEARAKLRVEVEKKKLLDKQKVDRMTFLLTSDPEFQRLKTEYAAQSKVCSDLQSITMHYRFTVGTMGSMFFSVKAQGDSWEEVIKKIENR